MKCDEAQCMRSEYKANLLPELTRRRLEQHLKDCPSCRAQLEDWREDSRGNPAGAAEGPIHTPKKSIVDAVMSRILSEEKWAIPIGRRVFTVTARMRRAGALAAMVLLVICSFVLYSHSDEEQLLTGPIVAPTKTEVIAASIEITSEQPEPSAAPVPPDSHQVASASGGIGYDFQPEEPGMKPNYGLVLGFFGILVTVLGMSWLTRA